LAACHPEVGKNKKPEGESHLSDYFRFLVWVYG